MAWLQPGKLVAIPPPSSPDHHPNHDPDYHPDPLITIIVWIKTQHLWPYAPCSFIKEFVFLNFGGGKLSLFICVCACHWSALVSWTWKFSDIVSQHHEFSCEVDWLIHKFFQIPWLCRLHWDNLTGSLSHSQSFKLNSTMLAQNRNHVLLLHRAFDVDLVGLGAWFCCDTNQVRLLVFF